MNELMNQPMSEWIIHQWNKEGKKWMNKLIYQWINESTNEWMNELYTNEIKKEQMNE